MTAAQNAPLADRISRLPAPHDTTLAEDIRSRLGAEIPGSARELIARAGSGAPYLGRLVSRHDAWMAEAAGQSPEDAFDAILTDLRALAEAADEAEIASGLRAAKSRAALLIALADLGGIWNVPQVTAALSRLADAALATSTDWLLSRAADAGRLPGIRAGTPPDAMGYTVLAMGKLGAGELNYSSDIDLICLFDQDRYDPVDYAEAKAAFVKLTRALIRIIGDQTAEGYVFRTDLRLRPAPSTTAVAMAMEAAERYYESLGRTWERAAHIKARPVAGDIAAGHAYLSRLTPFVWRRHLDFAAIEDTHEMLRKIREKRAKFTVEGLPGRDMKLDPGGIREIEFFAQTRQLIGGGRDPSLRAPATLDALAAIGARGLITPEEAETLADDYKAHRRLEHRLQMIEDAQTQTLPVSAGARARVAALDGWEDPAAWERDIADRLARVHRLTEAFFRPDPVRAPATSDEMTAQRLAALGFARPEDACRLIERWRSGRLPAIRSPRARRLFAGLEPRLIRDLAEGQTPDEAIAEFDRFLSGLPAGVQVFSLFTANPHLLDLIVGICTVAPRLAAHLGREPLALDALLSPDFFEPLPDPQTLGADLEGWIARAGDYEGVLDAVRRRAREWRFRAGVQVLRGLAEPREAGVAFSAVAETCIAALLPRVVTEFAKRHGPPPGEGLAVLAMGKLGSREMTAGSDLDLITVYDPGDADMSDGPRPLPPATYYPRLTQALVAALSSPTSEGRLYEVDMRLRPSGRQGPVATSLSAFDRYQREQAWVWEHLALTRARVVAGSATVGGRVKAIIGEALGRRAGAPEVLDEAREMRARLLEANRVERANPWSLKLAAGGVQEIEFLLQSGLLATGVGRVGGAPARMLPDAVEALAEPGWIDPGEAEALLEALTLQHRLQHVERVALDQPLDPETASRALKGRLAELAGVAGFEALEARLRACQAGAADIVERKLGPG